MGCGGTMAEVVAYVGSGAIVPPQPTTQLPQPTTALAAAPEGRYYPESFAQTSTDLLRERIAGLGKLWEESSQTSQDPNPLLPPCRSWGHFGRCEQEGHEIAHELICNREWCSESGCGGNNGAAHQRRKAKWYPKARQLGSIGRFLFTLPVEVRGDYRTKAALGDLGISFKRMMQRKGYKRGLRRWHLFGEDHDDWASGGKAPPFHPHLEVLVEAGHLSEGELDSIKASVARILKVGIDRVNVYYRYAKAKAIGRKCHFISYALRPTFTNWEWDKELAYEFIGFRNALSWGSWDSEPVWDVPVGRGREVPSPELMAIEAGYCPHDGSRIIWGPDIRRLSIVKNAHDWKFLDGGYWLWGGSPG